MTTPATTSVDGGTPESADSPVVPTVEEFREFANATSADATKLKEDLDIAVATIDEFCRQPVRPIPAALRKRWYLLVASEIFDASNGPTTSIDAFGNSRQTRSSRDPMHVIIRQVRRYVPAF
ncbi:MULTISPECIES: hypothetical protein [unclassified Rhodococcus (in: high G+C Gram-positive bacteria)]|uniref:hypothetical protein n=1 Tax=unclassified Rhodococcus (in: high G+C Gram-positive bacteria) TaxID=192944 RepID=UPI00117B02BA|nr:MULTISPECIES: hypothetical protein [unclassified Rhodococcus (in: high G+C Gram-positive bacteria)]